MSANNQVGPFRKAAEALVEWQMATGKFLTARNGDRAPVIPLHELEHVLEAACSQTVAPGPQEIIFALDQALAYLASPHSFDVEGLESRWHQLKAKLAKDPIGTGNTKQLEIDAVTKPLHAEIERLKGAVSTPRCPKCGGKMGSVRVDSLAGAYVECQGMCQKQYELEHSDDFAQFFQPDSQPSPASLAHRFHEAYERLAPQFGYETRKESAKPWADVPENNKRLMIAVCAEILGER